MSLINLKNALINKSIIIDSSTPELIARANETAETLINRSYRDHRTDDQIRANALEGTIREFAIAKLTGGEINSQTPDFVTFDRNTFAWDILAYDLFIEVKPQRGENFNIRERTKSTLINNSDYYDVWQGTVDDNYLVVEMNKVIDYYKKLGYTVNRKSDDMTYLYWQISW